MKKAWTSYNLARPSLTGPIDPMAKLSHSYCQICRRDLSVFTHGPVDILRSYQGAKHVFAMDQRLDLYTPGLRKLDFGGNLKAEEENERQQDRIIRTPLVRRELVTDESGVVETQLPRLCQILILAGSVRIGWEVRTRGAILVRVIHNTLLHKRCSLLVAQWSFGWYPCLFIILKYFSKFTLLFSVYS